MLCVIKRAEQSVPKLQETIINVTCRQLYVHLCSSSEPVDEADGSEGADKRGDKRKQKERENNGNELRGEGARG